MIATSRKSTSPPTISRQFEFSRFQDQKIACAYEVLIPVVSRPAPSELKAPARTVADNPEGQEH